MSTSPRVTVLSRRAVEQNVWQTPQYEFEDVVLDVEDAVLLSPPARSSSPVRALTHGAANRARRAARRPRRGVMRPPDDVAGSDLLFAVFAAPHEIAELRVLRPHLARFGARIAYLVEMWTDQVAASADYIRELRTFDHVFVFNPAVIDDVRRIAAVPSSYLPYGVDSARFAPRVPGPERTVDVTSYGRRDPAGTHKHLVRALAEGRLTYSFDTTRGPFAVQDYREHRLALASLLQRSRYSTVHKISRANGPGGAVGADEMLTTRYFEVAATGAVMLGTAPDLPQYREAFDWPDALITIPDPAPDIEEIIEALDREPDRLLRARTANVANSLRRHDWAYRWQEVLRVAGLEPRSRLGERTALLHERADEAERHGAPRR